MKNIYLISSSSFYLINNEISKITDGISDITYFSLNEVNLSEAMEDTTYYGLFSDRRAIVVKDVKYFGGKFNYEDESKLIIDSMNRLDDKTVVIFICDAILKTKNNTKELIKLGAKIIDYKSVTDEDIVNTINTYLEGSNIKIEKSALDLLIANSLKNIDIIIQEINKISNISNNITLDMVKTYGIVENGDVSFDFSNAVIAKDFNKAFDLLDILLKNGVEVPTIIGLLSSGFVNMYMVKDAMKHGLSDEEIQKIFGYSSTGRVYVLKKNGKIYTIDDLKEIITNLSELDKKIKTGLDPVSGLKEFLLNL